MISPTKLWWQWPPPQPNSFQDPSNLEIGQVEFQLKLEMSKPVWRLKYQSSESLVCGDDFVVKVQKLNWEKLASRAGKRNLRKLIKTTHIGIGPKNVFWAECLDAQCISAPLKTKAKMRTTEEEKSFTVILLFKNFMRFRKHGCILWPMFRWEPRWIQWRSIIGTRLVDLCQTLTIYLEQ